MQINIVLVQRGTDAKDGHGAWTRLFGRKYIRRTLIGVMIMFFQRKSHPCDSAQHLVCS